VREHRKKLLRLYGLDEVIIEPRLSRRLPIARLTIARERNQPHVAVTWVGADSPRDLEAVHAGQPDIKEDDLGRDFLNEPERSPPVSSAKTRKTGVRQHRA
jgi:hypothetical protein